MDTVSIPMLDLKSQYQSIKTDIQIAIERVLESQYFILGPEVEALEKEIAAYSECKYGIGVSSGTDALLVSLMAIGLKPGEEVITTPYSFFATAGVIARLGARPVFVDIDPNTFNLQTSLLEQAVTDRTKAIIPVHLCGQMVDMDPVMEIAQRYNLYVIEDAAQAIGAEYKGRRAGSIGHLGCFSFFPSKNLGGYGDSGMVTSNDPDLADRVRLLRNHGHQPKYFNKMVGGNFRMDALQGAVLRVKFKHLEDWTAGRIRNADRYRRLFCESGLTLLPEEFHHKKGVVLLQETGFGRHIYHLFMIRIRMRDDLMAFLKDKGISTEIYYPVPLHLQECFKELGFRPGDFPESERASQESLALPIYPELTLEMQTAVVQAIADFMKSRYAG
jgi:dTDP-4-amino-4,6-dideoxygalactose transaminase